jgi:hypothetical protein
MNIKTDECIELKNLQYKTMLSGGSFNIETNVSDVNLLDKFLEDNKLHNLNDNWAKMDNTNKIKKLNNYSKKYIEDNNLSDKDFENLNTFLKECIENKQLQRVKDVVYDKDTGEIKEVPALHFNKPTIHFTLKNMDKRVSTTRSLAPKKKGTAKNVVNAEDDSDPE